jgi:GH15 family glucan-1,4-alpha-glucosidase
MGDSQGLRYRPIGDYALIGDCRSAALVSSTGSIDWLCWPQFDSASVFGALLDADSGGRFSVAPADPFTTSRRYVGDTAILETTFRTAGGVVRLTDLMPVASEAQKGGELRPDHELLRHVECLSGTVAIEVLFDPRQDYGRVVPRMTATGGFGVVCEEGAQTMALHGEIPMVVDATPGARGRVRMQAGDVRTLSFTWDRWLPTTGFRGRDDVEARIARSRRWWEAWICQCRYDGPYARMVRRSVITLKLLTFAPSGAVIAAPTTSLPETIGGVRNWDYRYCWLRDASLTMRAFDDLGFLSEGEAFLSWLLHATRLTWPELRVLYDVYGEWRLPESQLDHFEGYAQSSPVRVGNAAGDQLQLDTYGEVIDAAWRYVERGGHLDRTTARVLVGLGQTVVRRWHEPDEGIWEPRSARRHHTHSKAMCWVGLDRLVRLCDQGHIRAAAARFVPARDAIREAVETQGYNASLGSYVSIFDRETIDASLLLLSLMGYADPGSARMRGTVACVRERLGANGLLYRYLDEDDGLPGDEHTFGICSFWGVESLALQGDLTAARDGFAHLLSFSNDVGLFAEEIDAVSGAAIGNFPQAFTHVGLINAATTIARAQVGPPGGTQDSAAHAEASP